MSESQTAGQFANVDIKQEVMEYGEHKIEDQYLDLPMKTDHDSMPENIIFFPSTIKKELETINTAKTTYFKPEIDTNEQFTTKSELLTTYCNFTTLKNDIKQEVIECGEHKIEGLPMKVDHVSMPENMIFFPLSLKKDLENTNKAKSTYLNSYCDFLTLKNEIVDYPDYYEQPCSTKRVKKTLKRRHVCPVCQKNFPSSKSRWKHINGHFGKSFTICQFCGKLMTKIDFLRHYFIHIVKYKFGNSSEKINEVSWLQQRLVIPMNEKSIKSENLISKKFNFDYPLQCDICLKKFNRKSNLKQHLVIHSGENPFKCEICCKGFSNKSNLNTHLKIHTNEKPFNCNICSKNFLQNWALQRHLISHTNKKPFKCDICSKEFKQKNYLKKHLTVHTNKTPFKCDICSKEFKRRHDLQKHLKMHTIKKQFKVIICKKKYPNEKPFECDICNKKFNKNSILRRHLMIHTNEKPFKCDICSKEFKRDKQLQDHLINHSDKKPFKCDFCSKHFIRVSNLGQHLKTHSVKAFKCEICSKQFSYKCNLKKHLLLHTNTKPL